MTSSRRTPNRKRAEVIARDVSRKVLRDDLAEGARLPVERDMMEELDVGRPALREALRLLESRGLLEVRRGRGGGPVVRHPQIAELAETLMLVLAFQGATIADVLLTRGTLEPTAARLAATRRPDTAVHELQVSIDRILAYPDNHDVLLRENAFFHSRIAEMSGSIVLQVFIDSLKSLLEGATLLVEYPQERRTHLAQAHQPIVDAIARKDPAAAEAAMHDHLASAMRHWQQSYPDLLGRDIGSFL